MLTAARIFSIHEFCGKTKANINIAYPLRLIIKGKRLIGTSLIDPLKSTRFYPGNPYLKMIPSRFSTVGAPFTDFLCTDFHYKAMLRCLLLIDHEVRK